MRVTVVDIVVAKLSVTKLRSQTENKLLKIFIKSHKHLLTKWSGCFDQIGFDKSNISSFLRLSHKPFKTGHQQAQDDDAFTSLETQFIWPVGIVLLCGLTDPNCCERDCYNWGRVSYAALWQNSITKRKNPVLSLKNPTELYTVTYQPSTLINLLSRAFRFFHFLIIIISCSTFYSYTIMIFLILKGCKWQM